MTLRRGIGERSGTATQIDRRYSESDKRGVTLLSQHATAARTGLKVARIRQLDAELKPIRLDGGRGPRVYLAERVEQFVGERSVLKGKRR